MTEEQAKAKWCPFARVGSLGGMRSGWNRPESESFGHRERIGGENHCIASACMAWRWRTERNPAYRPIAAWPEPTNTPPSHITSETHGGCGLAGSPQ